MFELPPPTITMLKVLALLASVAAVSAYTGIGYSSASGADCDEPRSWNIISIANNDDVTCDGVVYDPEKYRCCGKTLRRNEDNSIDVAGSLDEDIDEVGTVAPASSLVCSDKADISRLFRCFFVLTSKHSCLPPAILNRQPTRTFATAMSTCRPGSSCAAVKLLALANGTSMVVRRRL